MSGQRAYLGQNLSKPAEDATEQPTNHTRDHRLLDLSSCCPFLGGCSDILRGQGHVLDGGLAEY